jgi:hypothetical protein
VEGIQSEARARVSLALLPDNFRLTAKDEKLPGVNQPVA